MCHAIQRSVRSAKEVRLREPRPSPQRPSMLNHSPNTALSRTQTQPVRHPQRGDTHEREQRWEPVPCDDPSKASACQLRQMDGHQSGLAVGLARLAPPRTYGRRRAGSRRCKLDALAKRCETSTSSPQTFPGARLARGTAANEPRSPASGAVPACIAQLACQGMTSGPSCALSGSIASTTANRRWDI